MRRGNGMAEDLRTILPKLDRKERSNIVCKIIKKFIKYRYDPDERYITRACFFMLLLSIPVLPFGRPWLLVFSLSGGLFLAKQFKLIT